MPRKKKAKLVRAVVLAKAVYGAEAAPPCDALLDKLGSKILKCIGFKSKVKCNALAFDLTQEAGDLDPWLNVLVNRTLTLRRIVARSPGVLDKIFSIIRAYDELGMAGTDRASTNAGSKTQHLMKARGPVGLLLKALGDINACITNKLTVEGADPWPFHILRIPLQELKPRMTLIGRRARFRQACANRSDLQGSWMIDHT